jgi:hypothetical protein
MILICIRGLGEKFLDFFQEVRIINGFGTIIDAFILWGD